MSLCFLILNFYSKIIIYKFIFNWFTNQIMNKDEETFKNDHFITSSSMPTDSISQLRFFPDPQQNFLLAGSWDCKSSVFQINYQVNPNNNNNFYGYNNYNNNNNGPNAQINSNLVYQETFNCPVLSVCWSRGSTNYFSGLTDGSILISDPQKKIHSLFGKHEIGCKELCWSDELGVLISGGWDSRLCLWDPRSPNGVPALQYNLPKRVVSMSCEKGLLVVAMTERKISIFNLLNVRRYNSLNPEYTCNSHLRYQTRKVACFPNGNGYAIASIEGRIAIKNINFGTPPDINKETGTASMKDDYAFRCHRVTVTANLRNIIQIYPVHDLAFNPYGTFVSAGGDGNYIIWDKDKKSKIKGAGNGQKIPLTAIAISANGQLLSYAMGYDWAKGVNGDPRQPPSIGVHYLTEKERNTLK